MKALVLGFLLGLAATSLWAQATAQVHGTVQDASGSAISGAMVTATQTDTGATRTVTTEADGSYVMTNLPLGPYQIEAAKESFAKFIQRGVVLQVNSDPSIPIVMKVGAVSEQVTVEATATQVETTTNSVGSVVENQRILDLPLNGRQPVDLVALSGAAVVSSSTGIGINFKGVAHFVVAGGTYFGVEYKLDGAVHDDFEAGTGLPLPFPDALQEFKMSTSVQDPANSGHAGGTVTAVMKSGSNAFHGDMFEFLRNSDVNARDFFATGPDGLKRNQFGGTFGGPIKKDKLFFFAGFQGTTTRVATPANTAFVPTPAMQQGNFQPYVAAGCGKPLSAPYVNNMVPASLLSPAALAMSKYLPATINACGQVAPYAVPQHENDFEGDVRVDYQISEKQSFFVRNMIIQQDTAAPYSLDPQNILTASSADSYNRGEAFALGHTYILDPSKVNSFRAYLDRIADTTDPVYLPFGPQQVGIHMFTYTPNDVDIIATPDFTLSGVPRTGYYITEFGGNDDFSLVHGSHQFVFGAFFTRAISWGPHNSYSPGQMFPTGAATGNPLSDFMIGSLTTFKQGNPDQLNVTQPFFGLSVGDTWKINPRLTLNYGVMWNPFFGMDFKNAGAFNFSLANFYANIHSQVVAGAPPGFTYPGDPGFSGTSGMDRRWNQFNPRLGLAWDPGGDGKTVIRISGGIARDFVPSSLNQSVSTAAPFRLNITQSGVNMDNPWPQGDPLPYTYNPKDPVWPSTSLAPCLASTCPPSFLPIPPNFNTTLQYSWNFGVQRQVTSNWFLSATYIGTHLIHTWTEVELNPALYIPGNCQAGQYGLTAPGPCTQASNIPERRILNLSGIDPAQPLGSMSQLDDGGTQGYNGLLVTTNYRLSRGLNMNANYTYSHCIGLVSVVEGVINGGGTYVTQGYGQNVYPQNRDLAMGSCPEDRRQVLNFSLVYRVPQFSTRFARTLLSGWSLGTIITARSGGPINLGTTNTTDPTTGFGTQNGSLQRPMQVLPDGYAPQQTSCGAAGGFCVRYLNPAAFAVPGIGVAGNVGPYDLVGLPFWQWDQELTRAFRIRESQQLEVRFEAFNVTNSFRPGNPVLTVGSPTFGEILTDATPPLGVSNPGVGGGVGGAATNAPARVWQFALKYQF